MGKLDKYVCDGQMDMFSFIDDKPTTTIKRKNSYETPCCTYCGATVNYWKLVGQWPYQIMQLPEICPECNRRIEHPADLLQRADHSNNWCTNNKTPCNRGKTWEMAKKHGINCPETCCIRECNIQCIYRADSCTVRPKGLKSCISNTVTCEHDSSSWCNRFGILAEEQRKAAPKKGWACKGCCFYCSAAPINGGSCEWECRVKK